MPIYVSTPASRRKRISQTQKIGLPAHPRAWLEEEGLRRGLASRPASSTEVKLDTVDTPTSDQHDDGISQITTTPSEYSQTSSKYLERYSDDYTPVAPLFVKPKAAERKNDAYFQTNSVRSSRSTEPLYGPEFVESPTVITPNRHRSTFDAFGSSLPPAPIPQPRELPIRIPSRPQTPIRSQIPNGPKKNTLYDPPVPPPLPPKSIQKSQKLSTKSKMPQRSVTPAPPGRDGHSLYERTMAPIPPASSLTPISSPPRSSSITSWTRDSGYALYDPTIGKYVWHEGLSPGIEVALPSSSALPKTPVERRAVTPGPTPKSESMFPDKLSRSLPTSFPSLARPNMVTSRIVSAPTPLHNAATPYPSIYTSGLRPKTPTPTPAPLSKYRHTYSSTINLSDPENSLDSPNRNPLPGPPLRKVKSIEELRPPFIPAPGISGYSAIAPVENPISPEHFIYLHLKRAGQPTVIADLQKGERLRMRDRWHTLPFQLQFDLFTQYPELWTREVQAKILIETQKYNARVQKEKKSLLDKEKLDTMYKELYESGKRDVELRRAKEVEIIGKMNEDKRRVSAIQIKKVEVHSRQPFPKFTQKFPEWLKQFG